MTEQQIEQIIQKKLGAELPKIERKWFLFGSLVAFLVPLTIWAATITKPHTFADGDTLSASKLNENFDALYAKINELDAFVSARSDYAIFQSNQTTGSSDGACTAGTWYTRNINTTQVLAGSSISLNANQITLQSGTYLIQAGAPHYAVNQYRAKLRNVTDNTDAVYGTSEYVGQAGDAVVTRSFINSVITLAAPKTFEIQGRCGFTYANANGNASSFGVDEVYTYVLIQRLK